MSPIITRVSSSQGINSLSGFRRAFLGRSGVAGYEIERSLRFNSADEAYLSKVYGSTGNQYTATVSFWVKRAKLSTNQYIYDSSSTNTTILFNPSDKLVGNCRGTGATNYAWQTNAVFRDPSAWYHVVVAWDTTQGTDTDRLKVYVNGVEQTFSSVSYPVQNQALFTTDTRRFGVEDGGSLLDYLDAYLADIHFIDGQALDSTSFGAFDAYGIWNPIEYTGSYPDNSFHLDFADNSTVAALGDDTSPNGNHWVPNNFAAAAISEGPITSTNWYLYKLEFTATANGYVNQFVVKNNSIGTPFNSVNLINILKNGSELEQNITASGGGGSDSTTTYWTGPFNSRINQSPRLANGETGSPWGSGYGGNVGAYSELLTYSSSYTLGSPLTNSAPGSGPYTATFTGFSYSAGDTLSFYVTSYSTSSGNDGYFIIKGGATTGSTNVLVQANTFGSNVLQYDPAGIDSLFDSPTNANASSDTGAGGEVSGNYATLNPLGDSTAISNGNLDKGTSEAQTAFSTFGVTSGKFYAEVTIGGNFNFGIGTDPMQRLGSSATKTVFQVSCNDSFAPGTSSPNSTQVSHTGPTYASGDVIGFALDATNKTCDVYRNGSKYAEFDTFTIDGPYFIGIDRATSTVVTHSMNFGQRAFAYPVSGYQPWTTALLDDPTIADGSDYMDVVLYTGNGSTQTISGLGFSPDLVWSKIRSSTGKHRLTDIVRGASVALRSDGTDAEFSDSNVTAFNSDGWEIGGQGNSSGFTYAAWTWDAGSSTVTNTDGTITSSVRANASAGFSIVTYTSSSSVSTVGHGLNAAPYLIITKNRSVSNAWWTYHESIGNTKALRLDVTDAAATMSSTWNNTSPTSSVFTVGGEWGNGNNIVAYCFSPVEGYSSFGSYTGNGSADGPFVYTGFRPAFVLIKRATGSSGNWMMYDNARGPYNLDSAKLAANLLDEENSALLGGSTLGLDLLSNGFKNRNDGGANHNASGSTYIYAAFAENPLSIARAR